MDINKVPTVSELMALTEQEVEDIFQKGPKEVLPLPEVAKLEPPNGESFKIGLNALDGATRGGFRGGDLVVVSGISGHGKTSFCQSITYAMTRQGISTMWVSYEVSPKRLHEKFIAMGMEEDYIGIYAPKKNESGKLDWVQKKILEAKKHWGISVVCIDHIGFLTPTDVKSSDNEMIQLRKIARELKQMAITLEITIILIAHVKKTERKTEPGMEDISSSSGIYQEADYVFMVHRLLNENNSRSQAFGSQQFNDEDIFSKYNSISLVKNRLTGETKRIKVELINQRFFECQKQSLYN